MPPASQCVRLSDDFEPADTEDGGKRLNSDFTHNTIFAAASQRPIDDWEFGLTLDFREGERGIPTSVFDDRDDIFATRPRYERVRQEDGWTTQLSALYEPKSGWRNHAWVYTTNDTTVTDRFADASGGTKAVARLTATNRPGGGVDFRLENIAGSNYGPESFLKYIYLSPEPTFNLASLTWAQATTSEGEIGNINIRADNIDGYDYSLRVNFRRPEQGDSLFDGETVSWLFDQGDVNEFFAKPALKRAGLTDACGAVTMRRTLETGFWGPAAVLPRARSPLGIQLLMEP